MQERQPDRENLQRHDCQADDLIASSDNYPQVLYMLHRAREKGFRGAVRRILALLGLGPKTPARVEAAPRRRSRPANLNDRLGLRPGELVEVRSQEEIRKTLDEDGRFKGLVFMPEMYEYCGKRLKVYKRVERFILENTGEMRKMKDTVLLDGAFCDGWGGVCDRSCFFFWREAWLRRVEAADADR
jgi:hypothetical protein